jgi:hypothetical protein
VAASASAESVQADNFIIAALVFVVCVDLKGTNLLNLFCASTGVSLW